MAMTEEERKRKAAARLGGVPAVTPVDEPGTRARETGYAAGQALGAEAKRVVGDIPAVRAAKSIYGDVTGGEVTSPRAAGTMVRGAAGEALAGAKETFRVPTAAYKAVAKPVGEFIGGLAGRPEPQASEELAGLGAVPTRTGVAEPETQPPGVTPATREELPLFSPHQERAASGLGGVPAAEQPTEQPIAGDVGGGKTKQYLANHAESLKVAKAMGFPEGQFKKTTYSPSGAGRTTSVMMLEPDGTVSMDASGKPFVTEVIHGSGGSLSFDELQNKSALEKTRITEAGATARAQLGGRDDKAQLDFLKSDVGRLQKAASPGDYDRTAENVIAGYQEVEARDKYGQASGMPPSQSVDEDAAGVLLEGLESFAISDNKAAQKKLFNTFMKSSPKRQDLILDRMTPQARNIYQEFKTRRKARE